MTPSGNQTDRPRQHHVSISAAMLVLAATLSCGRGNPTIPSDATVLVTPASTLLVGAGETLPFVAQVTDASGATLPLSVEWSTDDPAVARVAADGVATAVATGTTRVEATAGSISGTALLEVWVPPEVESYEPGQTHFGRASYVEYVVGELPIVISAPHGGSLVPDEIPDRTFGVTTRDRNTEELSRSIRKALIARTGRAPHLIVSHLRRTKLDPNREIAEAAQANPFAENAWAEFHGFIEVAEDVVARDFGSGLYLDIHGHGHDIDRLELGYLLSQDDLSRPDEDLSVQSLVDKSSLRSLAGTVAITFGDLIRGPASLGTLLQDGGIRAVPSSSEPDPGGAPYFSGGYSTARHGSRDGGSVSGIQIEHHFPDVRDSEQNREAYAAILAESLVTYLEVHFGLVL